MLPELFVNELSLVPAPDVTAAQATALRFIQTIAAAVRRGLPRNLRMPEDFNVRQLAPAYFWSDFLSDTRVDRESRTYFRSLATKLPFLSDLPDIDAAFARMDCFWSSQMAFGLKAAYVADGLALSMDSQRIWDCTSIDCEIQEIVDDDVDSRTEPVRHSSRVEHLESHMAWIQARMQTLATSGKQLWQSRNEFFAALDWCPEIKHQMSNLPAAALASIVRGLFHLNAYCLLWRREAFDPTKIECSVSPDGPSTLSMYADERTFLCPDGAKLVFKWHAKVGHWRIYFDPSIGPGKLLIGYVGKHLRTTMFR